MALSLGHYPLSFDSCFVNSPKSSCDLPSVADTVTLIGIAVIPVSVAHTCTVPASSKKLAMDSILTVTSIQIKTELPECEVMAMLSI